MSTSDPLDFLDTVESLIPEEVTAKLSAENLTVEDLRGKVRSVTFRATRGAVTAQ